MDELTITAEPVTLWKVGLAGVRKGLIILSEGEYLAFAGEDETLLGVGTFETLDRAIEEVLSQ